MLDHAYALASVNRSLWGRVTPDLRGVSYELSDRALVVRLTYAALPDSAVAEMVSDAEAECIADFWQTHDVSFVVGCTESGQPLPFTPNDRWVYLRHEEDTH